jgi:hypothetical protein
MDSGLPKSASRARVAWATCAVLTFSPLAVFADWSLSASTAARHDNNVGNAGGEYNEVGDFSAAAKLSLFDLLPLGENYSMALGGNVGGEFYDKLIGLRSGSLDAVISVKKKWGLGAFAPWARATLSPGRTNFDDGYRDATIYRAILEFGKRLDVRWNLWGEYLFDRRIATPVAAQYSTLSTDVFSTHGRSILANLEYTVSERMSLTAGALLRHGDFVSTLTPTIYTSLNARAAVADPTFGPNAVAYQQFGTSYALKLAVDYSLTTHSLLGAGLERIETHAGSGNNYSKTIPELTWRYRF